MDRYDPFDSMDRMFDQFRRSLLAPRWTGASDGSVALPAGDDEMTVRGQGSRGLRETGPMGLGETHVRLEQGDDGVVAIADLPGFERDELTVIVDDGVLHIRAVSEASEEDDLSVRRRTRRVSEAVRVPADVDVDAIDATYRNGVLEVTLPTDATIDDATVIDVN